jgi:hypothetical protein
MFGRETRMLLRHYLEQGTSKSALARQLGVSRDMFVVGFIGAVCVLVLVILSEIGAFAGVAARYLGVPVTCPQNPLHG